MSDRDDMPHSAQSTATHDEPSNSLAKRSFLALKWSYFGVLVRVSMQLLAQIALARLLGPEAFGVVAAATLVIALSSLVAELGLGASLVQVRDLTSQQIRASFTRILAASLVVAACLYLMAGWMAVVFDNPSIAEVLHWLLPAFMFQAFGVVSLGLLKRKLDFKSIQIAQMTGYGLGFLIVGVGCALAGVGVWSLVAAWTVQNFVSSAILYARTRHEIRPTLRGDLGAMQRFGFGVVLTNIANWVIENIDNLVIGKVFGTTVLGGYAVAYNLVRTPANHAVNSIQQVMFPASARAQENPQALSTAYLAAIWAVGMLTLPVFVGVGAVADTVVSALYGAKWAQASPLLLPLALAMPLHAIMALAGPMLWGRGEVAQEFVVQFWVALLLLAALTVAAMVSPLAVAWAVFGVYFVRAVWLHVKVSVVLGLSFTRVLAVLLPGAMVAALAGGALLASDFALRLAGISPLWSLVTDIIVGALVLMLVLYFAFGLLLPSELTPFVSRFAARLPGPLAKALCRHIPCA